MKKTLFSLCLLASTAAVAQDGTYTINGNIANVDAPAIAYLAYKKEGKNHYDSCLVRNGKFQFTGTTTGPFSTSVVIDHHGKGLLNLDRRAPQDVLKMYVEMGMITLQGRDSLVSAVIMGSPLNKDYREFLALIKPTEDSLYSVGMGVPDAVLVKTQHYQDSTSRLRRQLEERRRKLAEYYLRANPSRYTSLIALSGYISGPFPNADQLESLFNLLSPAIQETPAGQEFMTFLNNTRLAKVGMEAPEIIEKDVTGKLVRLSQFRGQYVLVDFWASWCGPCREDNPHLVKVYNQFKDKNFTVLGVSLDKPDGKADWLKAIQADGLSWTHVSDLKGWASAPAKLYGVRAVPQNFLVDPMGKIVATRLSGDALRQFLEKALAAK